jgi:hypothetical protein
VDQHPERSVLVGPHGSSELQRLTISQLFWLAITGVKERRKLTRVIVFDESAMLQPGGKLCRGNPMSARGAKKSLRVI